MKIGKSAVLKIEGRSLPLNLLLIILNITGFIMLVCGYHDEFVDNTWLLPIGYIVFGLSLGGLVFMKGFYLFSYLSRVLVGGLFIVSGLVKANDPLGFAYKLEEYFEDGALAYRVRDLFGWESFSLEWLIEYALILSALICVIEIVLGVMVIVRAKIKLASWLLLGMMLFFTALTFHTSECDPMDTFVDKMEFPIHSPQGIDYMAKAKTRENLKIVSKDANTVVIAETKGVQCVSDCGCFGDALKGSVGRSLTPKESFWKDIVLGYFVLIIFVMQWRIQPNTTKENTFLGIASLAVVSYFSWVFSWFFPIIFALIALLLSLWIRRSGGKYFANSWGSILMSSLLSILVVSYVLLYAPIKDYRPYAVGNNIKEKMSDGVTAQIENTFVYKNTKTGETRSMLQDEYNASKIWEDKTWAFDTILPNVIVEGRLPSITTQFNPYISLSNLTDSDRKKPMIKALLDSLQKNVIVMTSAAYNVSDTMLMTDFKPEEYDTSYVYQELKMTDPNASEIYTLDYILNAPYIFILSSTAIEDANWSEIEQMKTIAKKADKNGVPFILMTGSGSLAIQQFKAKYNWDILILNNDKTELKAVSRSNPGLLILEKGIVRAKYPHRAIPMFETIVKNHPIK